MLLLFCVCVCGTVYDGVCVCLMIIQALLLVYNRPNLIRSQVGSVSTFWLYASVAYIFLNSFPNVDYFACFFLGRNSAFGL